MAKQKILITGSAGFMGSHLFDYVFKYYGNKYEVYGIDDLSGGFMRNVSQPRHFKKIGFTRSTKNLQLYRKIEAGNNIPFCG